MTNEREPNCANGHPAVTGTEAAVCEDIRRRQELGVAKYGQTVAENPLTLRQWLQHAYEESLDFPIYLKRAIEEIDNDSDMPADPSWLLSIGIPRDLSWDEPVSIWFRVPEGNLTVFSESVAPLVKPTRRQVVLLRKLIKSMEPKDNG